MIFLLQASCQGRFVHTRTLWESPPDPTLAGMFCCNPYSPVVPWWTLSSLGGFGSTFTPALRAAHALAGREKRCRGVLGFFFPKSVSNQLFLQRGCGKTRNIWVLDGVLCHFFWGLIWDHGIFSIGQHIMIILHHYTWYKLKTCGCTRFHRFQESATKLKSELQRWRLLWTVGTLPTKTHGVKLVSQWYL